MFVEASAKQAKAVCGANVSLENREEDIFLREE